MGEWTGRGTYVMPHAPDGTSDWGAATAGFAAGMAASDVRQGHFREPMGGATGMTAAVPTLQPYVPEDPGEPPEPPEGPEYGGVT